QRGTFAVTVRATDAAHCTGVSATYVLTVGCQLLTVINPTNGGGVADQPFSEIFKAPGAVGTPIFTTSSALPAGIVLETDGTLHGTPKQTGSYPIIVVVTDANGCAATGSPYG